MSSWAYRQITVRDGRTLAYAEYGRPSGRPKIIYCHGVPSSRVEGDLTIDDRIAAELDLRVIVPDRPGVGQSQSQPGRQSWTGRTMSPTLPPRSTWKRSPSLAPPAARRMRPCVGR